MNWWPFRRFLSTSADPTISGCRGLVDISIKNDGQYKAPRLSDKTRPDCGTVYVEIGWLIIDAMLHGSCIRRSLEIYEDNRGVLLGFEGTAGVNFNVGL